MADCDLVEFDEGHLMVDVAAARAEIQNTSSVMVGSLRVDQAKFPIRYVMQTISDGVREVRDIGWDALRFWL